MPQLAKTRIINLNYNDNKRTIYNELFDYGKGENTLFSMDNGIGKTVLIQFFLQPFIRNKRELASRKFDAYFTNNEATYIMHEVLLEHSDKLLVGMIIKKEQSEDVTNKLRILAFTHKYQKPGDFDIVNIPFVENKRILKFSEAEELVKAYSKGRPYFNYYNFNDNSKKTEYFNYLNNHNINFKEWEEIIRSINNDESGLSNLYDKYKDDEALIKGEIIPLIESKLNHQTNKIESIKQYLTQYVNNYKKNKESLNKLRIYHDFILHLKPIMVDLDQGVLLKQERKTLENQLTSTYHVLTEELKRRNQEIHEKEQEQDELVHEERQVKYEELSLAFYNYLAEETKLQTKLNQLHETIDNKQQNLNDAMKEKFILEAAEIDEEINYYEKKLIEVRERIKNYEKADSEISLNIRNYRFNLGQLYSVELTHKNEDQALLNQTKQNLESQLKKVFSELSINKESIFKVSSDVSLYKHKLDSFNQLELKFKTNYHDFKLNRNFLDEFDMNDLNRYLQKIENKLLELSQKKEALINEEQTNQLKMSELKLNIELTENELNDTKTVKVTKEKDLEAFQKASQPLKELLLIKNLSDDLYLNQSKLMELIKIEIKKYEESIQTLELEQRKISEKLERYQTGLITIPDDVLKTFEDKGIQFEYGLQFLQKYKGTTQEKAEILTQNPFFPYSIILNKSDVELLKSESLEVFTAIPIPILNYHDLNQSVNYSKYCDLIQLNNQLFLLSFNHLLLNEEERIKIIQELKNELTLIETEVSQLKNQLTLQISYLSLIERYPYKGNEGENLKHEIETLNHQVTDLQTRIHNDKKELKSFDERNKQVVDEKQKMNETFNKSTLQKTDFNLFIKEHEAYKNHKENLFKKEQVLSDLSNQSNQLEVRKHSIDDHQKNVEIELIELNKTIKYISVQLEQYKHVQTGEKLDFTIDELESKLKACVEQLGNDLKRDQKEEENLSREIVKYKNKLRNILHEGTLKEEYKYIRFDANRLSEVKTNVSRLNHEIKSLETEKNKVQIEQARITAFKQTQLNSIQALEYLAPIEPSLIKDTDFKQRLKNIKRHLEEIEEVIKTCQKELEKLSRIQYKLESFNKPLNQLDFKINFNMIEAGINEVNRLLTDFETKSRDVYATEHEIKKKTANLIEYFGDQDRLIKDRMMNFYHKDSKISSSNEIYSLHEVISREIRVMDLDMAHIKVEEETVINDIVRYCKDVLRELEMIDANSTIKHLGKSQKLLSIVLPEYMEEETLKEFIKKKVSDYSELETDFTTELDSDISTSELLSKLIGSLSRVKIEIKKIEKNGVVKKSWKETLSQNSGGEKFVSMFILLASFMAYMRKKDTDIGYNNEKKIIIMDNPFAKTNAEHLLEPMFQIAEKYQIQLICFSGIGGSSVYNRFNKIYVGKVITDRFRNKEIVEFNAGNEDTLEFSDFKIEQISLF